MRRCPVKKTFSVILIGMLFLLGGCSPNGLYSDVCIFSNIQECASIAENTAENVTVTVFENPDNDKNLKRLSYSAFWGCEYKADNLEFTLYAYVFENNDAANKYFRNETGKNNKLETNFSRSWAMGQHRTIALKDTRVYAVYTKSKYAENTFQIINAAFTEVIYTSSD